MSIAELTTDLPSATEPAVIDQGATFACRVLSVQHYTDTLFSFRVARPDTFRFRAGEFVMIGLPPAEGETRPVLRAYSVASPTWDEELEFYSIKAPGGALTTRLKEIKPGDRVLVGRKPTGTLVTDALKPGKRLYLLSTGTGAAPFASLIREPEVYDLFDEVVFTHTCRTAPELTYTEDLVAAVKDDPLVGDMASQRLVYFNSVTRDAGPRTGRITDLITSGDLFAQINRPPLDAEHDRVMICGSAAMLADLKAICEHAGFTEGSNARPGEFVIERAFAGEGID